MRKAIEENSRLLGKIVELEAQVKRNTAACKENFRLQKEIKKLKARLEAKEKWTTEVVSKAMEDFQASKEYEEEKAEYSADAYDAGRHAIYLSPSCCQISGF